MINKKRITKENIKSLPNSNHIFVYGSNLSGIHGAGAALTAHKKFGATKGRMHGLDNRSYGIPTKDENIKTLPLERITKYVNNFIHDATNDEERTYHVTEIGCGLAGYAPKDIAPLFKDAINVENINLPLSFWKILNENEL